MRVIVALFLLGVFSAPAAAQQFVVTNKVPAKFEVTNKCAPVPCFNCTSCGNSCSCFGGGYYCADGKCPVQPAAPASGVITYREEYRVVNGRLYRLLVPTSAPAQTLPRKTGNVAGFPYPGGIVCPPGGS